MSEAILREQVDANELLKKKEEYTRYIADHINNVRKAFQELFISRKDTLLTDSISNQEFVEAIENLTSTGAIWSHDYSKFGDEEFEPYRLKFYPTKDEEKMMEDQSYAAELQEKFDNAWMYHFCHNSHHPKHWKIISGVYDANNEPNDMTLEAIIHMICDWQAMSYHYKSDMMKWYDTQADEEKKDMSENTRKLVEEILELVTR